jgi:RNA polymerase sigma-70 factor (ECF subfamily)
VSLRQVLERDPKRQGITISHDDGRAFEELLGENLDALYRTALRLCGGHEADAEDLLQEAVLKAFRRFDQLRDPEAGLGWMLTILTRTHLNTVRSKRRRAETLMGDFDDGAFEEALMEWRPMPSPEELVVSQTQRDRLIDAVDALEPELRVTVVLAELEDLPQRQVAAMLDIPQGTVASRLFRARRKLRTLLEASVARPGTRREA